MFKEARFILAFEPLCSRLIYQAQGKILNPKHEIPNADFLEHPRQSRDNIEIQKSKVKNRISMTNDKEE
jgi:hypothetical protein